jgi:hypothetical protein
MEGCIGLNSKVENKYLIAKDLDICIHNSQTFQELQSFKVGSSYEDGKILFLTFNESERLLGMTVGQKLLKNEIKVRELFIFRKNTKKQFVMHKKIEFDFEETCSKFTFCVSCN